MSPKKIFIKDLAAHLTNTKSVMSGPELAKHLNRNNIKTDSGSNYVGSQGTYALVKATYKELISNGDFVNANNVALAFVKEDGTYAYL